MDYTHLSDFEINKLVESALRPGWQESDYRMPKEYCNNPADAWPIIVENLIALRPVALHVGGHRWFATKGEGDFGMKYADDNPLRAAMVLFLILQESANVQDNPA